MQVLLITLSLFFLGSVMRHYAAPLQTLNKPSCKSKYQQDLNANNINLFPLFHFSSVITIVFFLSFLLQALWLHRRFLSQCYINYFTIDQENRNSNGEDYCGAHSTLDDFLNDELELLLRSLDITDNEFEDTQVQAQHATAYIIWISKV